MSLAPETLDSDVIFVYMILISVWATMFLERWLRKQNTLAHLWGVMHIETEDIARREFAGLPRYNHWISENDSVVPRSALRLRALAIPFVVLSIGFLVGYQVTMTLYKSAFKDTDQLVLPAFPPPPPPAPPPAPPPPPLPLPPVPIPAPPGLLVRAQGYPRVAAVRVHKDMP